MADDSFELFDLRVEAVIPEGKPIYCGAKAGDYFELKGEMLSLPAGQGFSIYSLAAVLPLLAAKQRPTDANDWMTSDAEIACPDPNCASRLRIVRTGKRRFSHAQATAVPLPKENDKGMTAKTFELGPGYTISRVIRGGWQLAGGHGAIDRNQAVSDLIATFDAGIWTYDCADIYTGVEELIGAARLRLASERGLDVAARMKVHTKLVPDLERLATISRDYIRGIVEQSLRRLKTERLDLVQFHWWDYDQPRYVEAMSWLDELRREGKVRNLGTTNFDTPRLAEILAAGIPLVSQQLQYSVLDQRPTHSLAELAAKNGVSFLCYGSVAGGFLSDKWLGVSEPATPLENRSLVKYKLIIDDFGGWDLFQQLLQALKAVGDRHCVDIATIASAWVLEQPRVAAVIVGARNQAHALANAGIMDVALDADDRAKIATVIAQSQGPLGDVYTLERDRHGRHGSIMHYNLNAGRT